MNAPQLKYLASSMLIAMGMCSTAVIAEPKLEISGALEVEINSGKDHLAAKGSDIALATVEIGIDAEINKNVSAHILLLHEDDSTESPTIDEGTLSINMGSMFLNAGRMYIPFGNFESNMVSDPLTLELAETQEAAIEFGFESGGLRASVYAFNGEADKATATVPADNDVIDDFGISLSYAMKAGSMEIDFGADYINNMAETDALEGAVLGFPSVTEHTAGIALHAIFNMGSLTVIAEHISASDDFNTADLQFNTAKASPSASNIEIAYTMDMSGREITVAVAHQSTADMDTTLIGLPESRNMASISTTVAGDVGLAVEFSDATDYQTIDNGSGESGGMLTVQLAVEF